MRKANIPPSTDEAIFAAQLDFAPSQIIPELIASALTSVWETSFKLPPNRYEMPLATPQPALTAPQYADSLPSHSLDVA